MCRQRMDAKNDRRGAVTRRSNDNTSHLSMLSIQAFVPHTIVSAEAPTHAKSALESDGITRHFRFLRPPQHLVPSSFPRSVHILFFSGAMRSFLYVAVVALLVGVAAAA